MTQNQKQDLSYKYPNTKLFDAMRICYIYNVVRPTEVPQKIEDINDLTNEQRNQIFKKLKYEERIEFYELDEILHDSGFNNISDISKALIKGKKNDK